MNKEILNIISSVYGKKCCRVAVGNYKSLSFGFGERIFHNNHCLKDKFYGEWEIGTYYGSWRVLKNNKIILGSYLSEDDIDFLNKKINEIEFGEVVAITNLSELDVRVVFSNGVMVDFIPTFSDEDEVFHMFCPENIYVEFTSEGLWKIGKSNVPSPDDSAFPKS